MRLICIGGGAAGLCTAVLAKLRDPAAEVRVVERNPRGVTQGWGVVFWDGLVRQLRENDAWIAEAVLREATEWSDQVVRIGGARPVRLGGYGYSIGRARLLEILAERAESLGVRLEHRTELDVGRLPEADLVVATDGANSGVRTRFAERFATTVGLGRNYYIWLGTSRLFDVFTFAFERVELPDGGHGWLWLHGYRFDADHSTCIVECSPETWHGLGLDRMRPDEGLRLIQGIFAEHLGGQSLISQVPGVERTPWLRFADIGNRSWHHGNVVLAGDAAHTTHFSIGSGTELALADAVGLNRALHDHHELPAALAAYQADRSAALADRRRAANASRSWFEQVDQHITAGPVRFAHALRTRRDRPSALSWWVHVATQYRAGSVARRSISRGRRRLSAARHAARRR